MTEMAELLENLATIDGGSVNSSIKGVRFFKNSKQIRRKPLLYTPGICIVASGYKLGHLGGKTFRYDAGNYLVTSISMPFECESFPNGKEPLLGMFIDIDLVQLNAQYAATLSHQTGEQHTILDAINGALPAGQTPYASMLQLPPFTLTKTMSLRNSATPKTVSESLLGCKCEQSSSDTNRNDAETLSSINIRARAVQRSVAPIQTIV